MAEGQLLWMLNIGDVILSSRPYKRQQDFAVAFTQEEKRGQITIYRSSEPLTDRPTRFGNSWAGESYFPGSLYFFQANLIDYRTL